MEVEEEEAAPFVRVEAARERRGEATEEGDFRLRIGDVTRSSAKPPEEAEALQRGMTKLMFLVNPNAMHVCPSYCLSAHYGYRKNESGVGFFTSKSEFGF